MTRGGWTREFVLSAVIAALLASAVTLLSRSEASVDPAVRETSAPEAAAPEDAPEATPSPGRDDRRPRRKPPEEDEKPAVVNGTGELEVVPGESSVAGEGTLLTFAVEVEKGLEVDRRAFADEVVRVLSSPRSWGPLDGVAFQRVDSGEADFRVALAGPALTDQLCLPLQTNGIFSCEMGGRAVLNFWRWVEGADAYGSDLTNYRIYMINHEVGHALGHGHEVCPGAGVPAPVMVQQTKGVGECLPNPWPAP